MCLRFVFLLITRVAAWLLLSRREEAWKTAEILILRQQVAVLLAQDQDFGGLPDLLARDRNSSHAAGP